MKRNKTVIGLILLCISLIAVIAYQQVRLKYATDYINALENDYPDYIDTTSGGDEYCNWYQ